MATINTIHDLFQLLRENPEWADELRTLILTTELIDLPRKFAEFAEETRAHNAATAAAISELRDTQKETQDDVRGLQDTVGGLQDTVGGLQDTVGGLQRTVRDLQDDVGELKGSNAITAALRNPEMIVFAISEDLRCEAVLTSQDLIDMLRSKPGVIPQEDKMSFLEADLVIRAKDGSGEDHYITAEVSYTVGSNDVDRTIRNAGFLRGLTGKQSHAVVVGNYINGTAAMIIEREGIPWYQLRRRDTRPR